LIGLLGLATLAEAQWLYRTAPQPLIRSLRAFPNTPSAGTTTLVAATLTAGVWKAQDPNTGANWNWQPSNNGLTNLSLWTLTTTDGVTMYVGTDGSGIFKTTNSGANWAASNGAGAGALACKVVRAINFRSAAPDTVYAGTGCRFDSGMYKSTDGGATWARLGSATLPADTIVSAINLNSTGTQIVVATSNYGLYKSSDSGATWAQINNGIGTNPNAFNAVIVDNDSNHLVTYIQGQGIFKSTDAGANWAASNTGLPAGAVALGGLSAEGSTVLYYGSDKQGIYRSSDSGATWSAWGNSATTFGVMFSRSVVTSGVAGRYYVGMLNGVQKTLDSGVTWNDNGSEIVAGRVSAITHDLANERTMYVAVDSLVRINDVYGNFDSDSNAIDLDVGITGTTNDGVVVQDPTNGDVMYATTNNKGIFKSTNRGATWAAANNGLPSVVGQFGRLTIDSTNSQVLYVGFVNNTEAIGIYKSTDGGANWSAANTGLTAPHSKSVNRIEVDGGTPSTLYAATGAGLYKSTDSGASWTVSYSALDSGAIPLPVSNVRLNPANWQEVYIANSHRDPNGTMLASSGIHKSTNGGSTWSNVLPGTLAENLRVLKGGSVFAGLNVDIGQAAVLRSADGGAIWQSFSGGLLGSNIRTFGVDGKGERMLSVALEDGLYLLNRAVPDFNGNGKRDVLLKNTNGALYVWHVDSASISGGNVSIASSGNLPQLPAGWDVVGVAADFNGDGKSDVLLQHTNGSLYVWMLDGSAISGGNLSIATHGGLPNLGGTGWSVAAAGDFNGDGKSDLLLQHTSGALYVWMIDGALVSGGYLTIASGGDLPSLGVSGWSVAGLGDFNGDGKADVLLQHTSGSLYAWMVDGSSINGGRLTLVSNGNLPSLGSGSGWSVAAIGDFNGDGKSDILLQHSGGALYVWIVDGANISGGYLTLLANGGLPSLGAGSGWSIGGLGDFSGDGKADILLQHTGGALYLWNVDGAAISGGSVPITSSGNLPALSGGWANKVLK
jgi:hypothetical protein